MSSSHCGICDWHAALAVKVAQRNGDTLQVFILCQAEQIFWSNSHQPSLQINTSCMRYRREYAEFWKGENVLLSHVVYNSYDGPILARTPRFKSILEEIVRNNEILFYPSPVGTNIPMVHANSHPRLDNQRPAQPQSISINRSVNSANDSDQSYTDSTSRDVSFDLRAYDFDSRSGADQRRGEYHSSSFDDS